MKKATAFIPNLLTLLNLTAGCVAIQGAVRGDFVWAFWGVVIAAVFDFSDGFAARLLRATSPMGKELDSLADVVSFGVAPAMVAVGILWEQGVGQWWSFAPFVLAACAAYRLAKFNVDERQHEEFRGLPTPACALFFVGLPFVMGGVAGGWGAWGVLALVGLFSVLLVSDLPMFSLKFRTFGWRGNEVRYLFLLFAAGGLVAFQVRAVSGIVVCYGLISAIRALIGRK